jgi:hypothetical protein
MAAAGLESLIYEKKSEEKEEEAKPNPPKKPKLDLTKNRPAWVLGSVAEAVRSEGPSASMREGEAAQPPVEATEAVLCAEEGATIAVRRASAGCREEVGREGEARTGVGGEAGPTDS